MPRFILFKYQMENLRITTVQSKLHWKDISSNLKMFDEKLEGLAGKTDLVILPEMFTTGFTMEPADVAEKMDGSAVVWMKEKANNLNAVITGSLILEEDGNYYNRVIWMRPDGTFDRYDKRHLFTLAGEHEVFTKGEEKLITEWKGWKICPLVCYDLRFPVWSRNTEGYDLLIYMANWPEKRSHHWRTLVMARAIENQCFVAAVNRVGRDEMSLNYIGHSSIIDYSGQLIYQAAEVEGLFTCEISKPEMQEYRSKLRFLPDQDKFQIFP